MAPIRRYLRITKYSVLEVRIYLDKPSDSSWLLSTPRNSPAPILKTILEAARPYVLPKLREENEHARAKNSGSRAKKKRGIKDVVSTEDFEVTIFLTELSTRHSLVTKAKTFAEDKGRLKGNGKGLAGWLNRGAEKGDAIRIEDDGEEGGSSRVILREDGGDEVVLADVPDIGEGGEGGGDADKDDEALFVSSSDEEFFQTQREKTAKRRKKNPKPAPAEADEDDENEAAADDKKKLAMNTSYDGFSIYGRILCLVVKRKGKKATGGGAPAGGSQMMEQWVSTQAAQEAGLNEDDEG